MTENNAVAPPESGSRRMTGSLQVRPGSAGETTGVRPANDELLKLVHALVNGGGLAADARLLLENERYARNYALAALAGEELGKIEFCLDWLLGTPTLSHKQFVDAGKVTWRS